LLFNDTKIGDYSPIFVHFLIERVSDLTIAYLFHIINIYQRHTETISNNVKEQTNKAATKRTKTIYTVHPMYKKNKKSSLFAYSFRNNP